MKIRKTCLSGTRILKGSGPVSKKKTSARWIFWVFKGYRFFDEVCKTEIVAEIFYVSVITDHEIIFIT